jgi:protein-serine/threonine kinase
MLAGYLPFDDDPANPEGDNINLLYKYIVSTPLTFPEYVTPHARDLLKRILVPDPRKRADLFEVARHSWLSDYAHVVSFITSSTTTSNDIAKTPVFSSTPQVPALHSNADPGTEEEPPLLARSASVREPGKPHTAVTPVGGLTAKRDQINRTDQSDKSKASRDNKRRTVQVEYVAPQSQTVRGEASPPSAPVASSKSPAKEQGPSGVSPIDGYQSCSTNARQARPTTASNAVPSASSARPTREPQRSVSDYAAFNNVPVSTARPSTGGTLGGSRLPSRGNSYGQPVAATVAQTNAEGRFSQPKGKQYSISSPLAQNDVPMGEPSIGQPSTQRAPANQSADAQTTSRKGHRRSNTVSETFGRVTSMFSSRQHQESTQHSNHVPNKIQKSYPPTSMSSPLANDDAPRQSHESSRRTSFGFSRKNTEQSGASKSTRRFSLLPSSLSKTFTSNRESLPATSYSGAEKRASAAQTPRSRNAPRPGMAFGHGDSRSPSRSTTGSNIPGLYDGQHESGSRIRAGSSSAPAQQTQFNYPPLIGDEKFPGPSQPHPASQAARDRPFRHANDSEASETPSRGAERPKYPAGFNSTDGPTPQKERPGVLQKHRKFADAYEDSKQGHHSGSSGSAKRVMDLFRRLGRQRTKEER